jgi:alpha-D-ribose 1-methylphosphonate 5-triphosphate synthase subunit PhnG
LSPIATATLAFFLILGSTIIGTLVRAKLPEHHLTGDSKEVIRLATALVATLTGLVLALMFAATRTSFENTSATVSRLAVNLTDLDEHLEYYGPETLPIRRQLRADLNVLIDSIWQEDAAAAGRPLPRKSHGVAALAMIRELQPRTPAQSSIACC